MSTPPEPRRKTADVAALVHKAVKELPPDEQQAVVAYFVECGLGLAPPLTSAMLRARMGAETPDTLAARFSGKSIGPSHHVVPVRLSETQHRRLKGWCGEHDFPMSVVIRGLVDRFLDDWESRAKRAEPA